MNSKEVNLYFLAAPQSFVSYIDKTVKVLISSNQIVSIPTEIIKNDQTSED